MIEDSNDSEWGEWVRNAALWFFGFVTLIGVGVYGFGSLFPLPVAIAVAVLFTGLASACFFRFAQTGSLFFLGYGVVILLLCTTSDGMSVYQFLNAEGGDRYQIHTARAEATVLEKQLYAAKFELESQREQLLALSGLHRDDGQRREQFQRPPHPGRAEAP